MTTHIYDNAYYDAITTGSLRSARTALPIIFDVVRPESLLDVGSGIGAWSKVATELGVSDIRALDGDYVDRDQLLIPRECFTPANLEEPFDLGRRFDLAMTLEVAEHLPDASAAGFVKSLTNHADVVLFSAAIPRQGGENHLNEQWPEYWAEHFAACGYVAVDYVRPRVWRDPSVELWYAQNMLLFVRADRLADFPELADSARQPGAPLALVHPKLFDIYRPWSDGPYSNPFDGRPVPQPAVPVKAEPAAPGLDLVIFSKDRAAQLELCLRSVKRFFAGWEQVNFTVVYTASTDEFARGYDQVRAEHPEFRYVDERERAESSFKELTLEAVGIAPYVAFMVDDNVFRAPFELDTPEFRAFAGDPDIACLSVRMCPRMDHCYPTDEITPAPEFERGTVWEWGRGRGGWAYPMSLDFHVFRSPDVIPLIERLDFFNPNSLEEVLAHNPLPAPKMICFEDARVVNLPLNRVQDTHANRHAGTHSADDLNAQFVAGRRLDLEPIVGVMNTSTHHEMELHWRDDDQPLRSLVTLVHADELLASRDLLAGYELCFGPADDATLLVYQAEDAEVDRDSVELAIISAGLADADVRILAPGLASDAGLAATVSAVLSDRPPSDRFAWLPHFGAADAPLLRKLLPAGAPPQPAAPVSDEPPLDPHERFQWELARYRSMPGGADVRDEDLFPQLDDRTPSNPYDPHYFHQDVWAARRIAEYRPASHVDVGSRVDLVGFLTAICPVKFVDIRALPVQIEDFESVVGSIVDLPFADRSLESVSCLHVAEHIGLGRYGDPLDPHGTVKAAAELQRVVAPGGHLLFAGPVGRKRTCFNAHRIHDVFEVIEGFFPELELVEFSGVDDQCVFRRHRAPEELAGASYACGMFHFVRPSQA